ncbi:competence type IV pilus major pilin ComGC [Fundicoccus sp. Sow4_D5]|uniref:competence type IV pilus major pilin ComGC n=1 Tax=unclassified Fundicoccus TaxID=2761543 RepID=UPI003F8F3220
MKKNNVPKRKKGFTLIEMLIVLVVVALLMAIIIPNVAGQRTRIDKQATQNIAEILETQANTYLLVEDDAEVTLGELISEGYITSKQATEAGNLLNFTEDSVITLPIEIPSE